MNEKWHLWRDGERPPTLNMAVDELLLEESGLLKGRILLRIYGWDRPSISIGYTQKYGAVAKECGYSIVRRPTGGGIVYHDRDLTYTVVVPAAHSLESLDRVESYHVFHRAVLRAMSAFGKRGHLADSAVSVSDRATMKCFVTPTKYDVICENRKMAGAAQRRTRKGILHQGSISLEVSGGDRDKLSEELIKGFAEEFKVKFEDFNVPDAFVSEAGKLSSAKFATDEWNKAK
ncbi:MAG: biotin/lipoate A/B protein ligase family protein [Victivallales bacterium]|jgi:lipoate-protein ligase A